MMRSLLDTDGYKFSMAEAGFPLREETFYYSHRKGGWQYLPIDVEAFILENLSTQTPEDYAFLDAHNYFQGGAFRQAIEMHTRVKVTSIPQWSWFFEREPVFSVTGPSAIVSWLEPLLLQLNRRVQIATCALLTPERLPEMCGLATCDAEAAITEETLDSIHVKRAFSIKVDPEHYSDEVFERARRLVEIVKDPNRLIEVGLRAASCFEQHEIALRAIHEAGVRRTSNVGAARRQDMIPVGTMGHEHVQRMGGSYAAFVASRDRVPGFISYLPDTYSTLGEGVPAALAVMAEDPSRNSGIRFDSEHGIRGHYVATVCMAREMGLLPYLTLESGWDDKLTVEFEELRETLKWPVERQGYGLGNFFVKPSWPHFGRDTVSAVYKLSRSLTPCMKMGDEPGGGKESLPGNPAVWRPHLGMAGYTGPVGYVAQEGEDWHPAVPSTLLSGVPNLQSLSAHVRWSPAEMIKIASRRLKGLQNSPATQALVDACYRKRAENIAAAFNPSRST